MEQHCFVTKIKLKYQELDALSTQNRIQHLLDERTDLAIASAKYNTTRMKTLKFCLLFFKLLKLLLNE